MAAKQRTVGMLAAMALLASPGLARGEATIEEVVVYQDRAQVTRSQQVDCAAKVAHFASLPSTLDHRTLWASVSGGPGQVVGLTHTEQASGPRPEAKALQDKIRVVDEQRVVESRQRDLASATEKKLNSFREQLRRVWGHQATDRKAPVRSWDAALDLLRQQALAAGLRRRKAETRRRQLQRQRNELYQQLTLIERKRRRTTYKVTALLQCAGRRTVRLSYVVPGATWRISYQFRANPARRKVTLVAQAVVQQGTGEDWTGVNLAVSTANLRRINTPPSIQRMKISTHKPVDTQKVLTRRFEHRRHLKAGKKKDKAQTARPGGARGAGKQRQGLAMKLQAARQVSVPSDGREVLVELTRKTLTAELTLETVPKLYPYVYRKASINNPFAFTLLPGPVEVHRGRAFVGRAQMKRRAPGEPFAFSLGVENQLQVHRYIKKEKLVKPGALSADYKLRHRYVIQLGNWTRRAQTVRVLENLPVSQARQVKVALSQDSTAPAQHNKTDGILTWVVRLKPRSKKKVVLDYTVKVPKDWKIYGY